MTPYKILIISLTVWFGLAIAIIYHTLTEIPKHAVVCGVTYQIYFTVNMPKCDGYEVDGLTDLRQHVIMIDARLSHDELRHVLMHELEHAAVAAHNETLSREKPVAGRGETVMQVDPATGDVEPLYNEDDWVEMQSGEMWRVVRDNPAIVRWLGR